MFIIVVSKLSVMLSQLSDEDLSIYLLWAAGMLISALFKYFPKLNTWYAGLSAWGKRLFMIGSLVITGIVIFASSCAGLWSWVTCDEAGGIALIGVIFNLAIGSQLGHLLLADPTSVVEAKVKVKEDTALRVKENRKEQAKGPR